jgi:hypothetical protein
MHRNRLRLGIYLSAALVAVGGGIGAAVAATSPSATEAGGLTATRSYSPTTAPAAVPTDEPTRAPASNPPEVAATTAAPEQTTPANQTKAAAGDIPVAPYVDMGLLSNPGAPTLAQMATSGGVKSYTLAFINSAGCKASWFGAFDPRTQQFKDQIDELRAAGGDVRISFGGATGIELAAACTDVAALQAEYQAVIDAYDLTYMDLDIEGAAGADTAAIGRRSTALAALQQANPGLKVSLTLPVLPEGLVDLGLNQVRAAKDAGVVLDVVNIMAMDYGRSAEDYGDLAIKAVQSTKDQLKTIFGNSDAEAFAMVGVTPMLGKNDDQGTFAQDDARDLVTFANDNGVGYASFWEANRDRNACNGALFQCTNVPQTAFEFSNIFAGFTG